MDISGFLKDRKTKELSATRLIFVLWVGGVFVLWAYMSFLQKQLVPIPQSVVTIIGLLMGGKAIQRFGEG